MYYLVVVVAAYEEYQIWCKVGREGTWVKRMVKILVREILNVCLSDFEAFALVGLKQSVVSILRNIALSLQFHLNPMESTLVFVETPQHSSSIGCSKREFIYLFIRVFFPFQLVYVNEARVMKEAAVASVSISQKNRPENFFSRKDRIFGRLDSPENVTFCFEQNFAAELEKMFPV